MKVKNLKIILDQYAEDTDIFVLDKHRSKRADGAGKLLKILDINESTDQDTNKTLLYLETEKRIYVPGFESEEEYLCPKGKEVNNSISD